MRRNCKIGKVNFQVPWGKHNPPAWRHKTIAALGKFIYFHSHLNYFPKNPSMYYCYCPITKGGRGVSHDDTLPVVIIKDPINWIHSMCKHPYGARWRYSEEHCPNLIPNE